MTWRNPPPLEPIKPKQGKKIAPEDIAGASEHSQQAALFAWSALNVGKYPQLKWMFAIPNGGLRDIRTATNLKAEGVKAGVPDIFLAYATYNGINGYFGLFIEMKVGKNKPSVEQIEWLAALSTNYYCIAVCYSWEEARDVLVNYLENKI